MHTAYLAPVMGQRRGRPNRNRVQCKTACDTNFPHTAATPELTSPTEEEYDFEPRRNSRYDHES